MRSRIANGADSLQCPGELLQPVDDDDSVCDVLLDAPGVVPAGEYEGLLFRVAVDATDRDLQRLGHAKVASSIEHVYVESCPAITDAGVRGLGTLRGLSGLDIAYCPQVVGSSLTALVQLKQLTIRNATPITDSAIRQLASMPALSWLVLGRVITISDDGGRELEHVKTLEVLRISGCPHLGDPTARSIAKLPNLQELWLSRCAGMSDAALEHLALAPSLSKLRVTGTPFSPGALEAFRSRRPDVSVTPG